MRLALLLCVAACGNPDNNHEHLVDAATQHDAPHADAHHDIDAPPPPRQGQITFSESNITGQAPDSGVEAAITDGPAMGNPTATDGPCAIYSLAGNGPTKHSAGVITVTGTTVGLTLTPAVDNNYDTTPTPPADLFATGATIHVAAAGGEFNAFAGDVTAPGPVAGFTPPASISVSAGTTLTWTAATSSVMQLVVLAGNQQAFGLAFCRVPDNGSFTVPPSTLAFLPANPTTGGVILGRTNETVLNTGGGAVTLQVVSAAGSQDTTFSP
jgi:plastocyanin